MTTFTFADWLKHAPLKPILDILYFYEKETYIDWEIYTVPSVFYELREHNPVVVDWIQDLYDDVAPDQDQDYAPVSDLDTIIEKYETDISECMQTPVQKLPLYSLWVTMSYENRKHLTEMKLPFEETIDHLREHYCAKLLSDLYGDIQVSNDLH
jgi:hypothetical protein